jgi:hypothetical protein
MAWCLTSNYHRLPESGIFPNQEAVFYLEQTKKHFRKWLSVVWFCVVTEEENAQFWALKQKRNSSSLSVTEPPKNNFDPEYKWTKQLNKSYGELIHNFFGS